MASRPKRVSLKGKGADIFFGDYVPPTLEPASPDPVSEVAPPPAVAPPLAPASADAGSDRQQASKQAGVQASEQGSELQDAATPEPAGKQERKRARTQASKQADTVVTHRAAASDKGVEAAGGSPALGEISEEVWAHVDSPATITNSFRYTEAELSAVDDVLYEIGRQRGARLTKQDVARLGLNVVLDDFRRRGPASLLGQLAARRRQRRGG